MGRTLRRRALQLKPGVRVSAMKLGSTHGHADRRGPAAPAARRRVREDDATPPTSTPASVAHCSSSWRSAATSRWSRGQGCGRRAKVQPDRMRPRPADPVLVEALALVAEKERTAQDLVGRLGKKRREPLLARLEARRDPAPARRTPCSGCSRDAAGRRPTAATRRDVRRKLGDALVRGRPPDAAHRRAGRRARLAGPRAQGGRPGGPPGPRAEEAREGDRRRRLGRQGRHATPSPRRRRR